MHWTMSIAVALIIGANVLWYWIKAINKTNGYKAHLFFHGNDFGNFRKVINAEKDEAKKLRYRLILYGVVVCIALSFAFVLVAFANMS